MESYSKFLPIAKTREIKTNKTIKDSLQNNYTNRNQFY